MKNTKIKNLKRIALNLIDEYQAKTQAQAVFNDPRGIMTDVDMSCSLLRKQLRNGYISFHLFPRSIQKDNNFIKLTETVEKICDKIKAVIMAYKA